MLLLSLLAGFVAVGVIFTVKGVNPLYALWKILAGSFGSLYGISETITKAIPLILIGSGLTLAFRAKFWNIGAESQLLMGAIFATWVGLNLGPRLPGWVVIPLMFLVGFVGGAIWGILPAVFKVRFGVNEVISTLMLNYVAYFGGLYLINFHFRDKDAGYLVSYQLPQTAWLKQFVPGTRMHYGILLSIVFAAAVAYMARKDELWVEIARPWGRLAWFTLTLGIGIGAMWAYVTLGWGGYWAWDPVENAALMPWLTGTAFLHSVMIQEKKGMFKGWNVALIVSTYLLVVMGTLNVRGGLVSSVHAFAESNIGWFMLFFLLVMSIFSAFLDHGNRPYRLLYVKIR